jgi:hypothetical protein
MEEWPKGIFEMLESVACMVDEFFLGVTEMVESFADDVQNTVGVEIDQCLQDMFEPIAELYAELEDLVGDTEQIYSYPVEPTPEKHPACMGCRHYHGQAYGGNLFVCAMHPYGWETEDCPDWESMGTDSSNPPKYF